MIKFKWLVIGLLVIALAVLPVLGCAAPAEEEEEEEEVGPTGTIYIGGTFPLTGPYPEDGQAVLEAYKNYAAWVNANHKISPWGTSFPEGVTVEVTFLDDKADAATAQTNYALMMAAGYKTFRISGSGIATAIKDTLVTDEVAATTMASGPYLLTPTIGTIFMNYPIYTDQMAAAADWFMERWKAEGRTGKPRVAYLTNTSFGQTLIIPAMKAYLEGKGYEVVEGCPAIKPVPTSADDPEISAALTWCRDNHIDFTIGAMLVVGAVYTMTKADQMGIGWNKAHNMTVALCSPAHLTIFLRDTGAPGTVIGNGLVIAGSYPGWDDTSDGVQFCKTLMSTYREGGFDPKMHIMYQHGVVEAMIQVEAYRLAMINTGKSPADLTSADVLHNGFRKIAGLDTKGILPTTIAYGLTDIEGADAVVLHQNQNGANVRLGAWPLRHVY